MTIQEKLSAARSIANGTAKKKVDETPAPQTQERKPDVGEMDIRSKLNAAREIARGTVQRGPSPTSTKTTPSVSNSPLLLPAKAALVGLTLSQKPMLDTAKLVQKPINAVVESVRRHEAEKRERMEGYLALGAAARELGQFGVGNIDLYNRPQFPNEDGTISTVRSISINEDGKEIVIPTVRMERRQDERKPVQMTDQEAINYYHLTGKYLGKFDTREEAEAYAQKLHQAQEFYYGSRPNKELMTRGEPKLNYLATIATSLGDEMAPPVYEDSGWKDPFYAWVNGSTEAGTYLQTQDNIYGAHAGTLGHIMDTMVGGNQEAAEMTPEEIATYNYIYANESPEEAIKFYEYIKSDLYRRQRKTEEEMWAKRADKDPAGTSIFSTLMSPAKVISYAMQLGDYLGDGKIDQNAPYNSFSYVPAAIRSEVAKNTEKYWVDRGHKFVGKSASFLYQTGMSMGDFVFNTAVSGGSSKVALAIMGTGAAADATIEAKDRGLSDDQAFALGTIAGIAEIVTERFSLDALLKGKWEQGAIRYILKNAITEGSEEGVSGAINFFADILISKDQSKWAQAIASYKNKGKSDSEALRQAVFDQIADLGLDVLGGILSGGTLAGGNVTVNTVINQKVGRNFRQSMNDADGLYQAAIDKGLESDPDTNAHYLAQRYQKVLDKKGSLSDGKLGGLYRAIIADIEAKKHAGRTVDTTATQNPAEGVKRAPVEGAAKSADPLMETARKQAQKASAENFRQAMDSWDGNSKMAFDVGRTSTALQSIGVKDQRIRLQSDKVNGILEKHPGMTKDIIKMAPDILESPVLVAKSKTHETRIVVFGEVFDANGAPVLAALELQPTTKGGEVVDVINLSSLYGKDKNPADFIRSSDIVFLDQNENRTKAWLQSVGLQLPSDATTLGPIGSITYADGKVKVEGRAIFQQTADVSQESGDGMPNSVGAAAAGFTGPYGQLQNESNAFHPDGENRARQVDVPIHDFDGRNIPKAAATVMEAEVTPDSAVGMIQSAVADGTFSFETNTDEGAKKRAQATVEANGWDGALSLWMDAAKKGKVSKDLVALGQLLLNNAMNAPNVDSKVVIDILSGYASMSTTAAQSLQAQRILKKLSPEGKLYACQRSLEAFQTDLNQRLGDKAPTIRVDQALYQAFLDAGTDVDAQDAALKAIYQNVADQIPASFLDKWNAWRYLSMLGNPRTHIRNVGGNAAFAPVRGVKNALAFAIENVVNLVNKRMGGDGITRTKSAILPILSRVTGADGDLVRACYRDVANVEDQLLGSGKYAQSAQGQIDQMRTIFKTKPLEAVRNANSTALDVEDTWFSRPAYAGALAGYLKANGVTAQMMADGTVDAKVMTEARAYAIKEAQKATYRDANAISDFIAGIGYKGKSKVGKAFNTMVEGVLPFKRTPANILVRGLEYSPAGLLKGLTADLVQVKNGNMTAATAIDNIAAGLTGTGLLVLGAWLASMGLVSGGGGDDEEDDLHDLTGGQDYALNLPGGYNVTLDWLAPEALPFFMGVELHNAMSDNKNGGITLENIEDAAMKVTDPLMEMSMLQSLQDAIDAVKFSDGGTLIRVAANAGVSYLSQGVPTLFGQVERTLETERETTFTDKTSGVPKNIQYLLGRTMNKTPGEYQQIPYIDAWGRHEETGTPLQRAVNNFLNPAYVSKKNETAADKEIRRLLDAGQTGVVPERPAQSDKINNENLTAEEYVAYAETKGQLSFQMVSELIESDAYKGMSDADKAKAISEAYSCATALAKNTVKRGYEVPSQYKKAQTAQGAGVLADYYVYKLKQNEYEEKLGKGAAGEALRRELMGDRSLTAKQKRTLDELLISDTVIIPKDVKVDYSNPESFTITQMSEAAQKKWSRAQELGYTAQEYKTYYGIYAQQGKKKDEKLKELEAAGLSRREAKAFWKAMGEKDEDK